MLDVRIAEEKDICEIVMLISKYFCLKGNKEIYEKIKKYSSNGKSLVAIYNNKIVGHIFFEEKYCYQTNYNYYWLSYVCVDENIRRKKIATKMLEKLEQIGKENNIAYIKFISSNFRKAAHACYKKNNYEKVDTTVFQKNIMNK